jgi:hypothetical protein
LALGDEVGEADEFHGHPPYLPATTRTISKHLFE